jgi:MarR family transcriptional regulator, organic hydroperoxide resistance regulator
MTVAEVRAVQRAYPQIYLACHTRHRKARSSDDALSERDGSILAHIESATSVRPTDLARHLGVGAPTLSEALERLAELGYVAVRRSRADGREREVRLTAKGARAMSASSVLDAARVRSLLERLPAAERKAAVRGLELLARAAREEMEGSR